MQAGERWAGRGGLLPPAFCLMHPDIPLAPRSLTLLCFLLSHQDKKLRIFDPRAGPAASQVLSPLGVLQAALPDPSPAGGWALVPQTIPALAGLGRGNVEAGAEGRGNRAVPLTLVGFGRGAPAFPPGQGALPEQQHVPGEPCGCEGSGLWAPGLGPALRELDQRLLGMRTR